MKTLYLKTSTTLAPRLNTAKLYKFIKNIHATYVQYIHTYNRLTYAPSTLSIQYLMKKGLSFKEATLVNTIVMKKSFSTNGNSYSEDMESITTEESL